MLNFAESPSALQQLLALIPQIGLKADNTQAQGSPAPLLPLQQNKSNLDTGSLLKQAGNLQNLPWLSTGQNLASQASALGQASGTLGGSAISYLAKMFL